MTTTALTRMMRFLLRLRRAAGEYFPSTAGARFAEGSVPGIAVGAFSSAILFSWEILFHALLAGAQGTNERNFREIIVVQTGNVLFVRAGDRLLRLHDLYRIGDARRKAIAGLRERLVGQIDIAARNLYLLRRRLQVQQRRTHVGFNLRAQIVEPLTVLLQSGV